MEISFIRKKNNQNIISCKRKDGSVTWMHSSTFFIMHDIIHYSVETVLNLQTAFYGMLSQGIDIRNFDMPRERRTMELSDEAIFAEQVVNLLGIEYTQGRMENFIVLLKEACNRNAVKKMSVLNKHDLEQIRMSVRQLMQRWNNLQSGEIMTLTFEK